jgi:hypothetical protein
MIINQHWLIALEGSVFDFITSCCKGRNSHHQQPNRRRPSLLIIGPGRCLFFSLAFAKEGKYVGVHRNRGVLSWHPQRVHGVHVAGRLQRRHDVQ